MTNLIEQAEAWLAAPLRSNVPDPEPIIKWLFAEVVRLQKKTRNQRRELRRLNKRCCPYWTVYGRGLTHARTYDLRGLMHRAFGYEAVHRVEMVEADRLAMRGEALPVEPIKQPAERKTNAKPD